jgi:hypothetical protein
MHYYYQSLLLIIKIVCIKSILIETESYDHQLEIVSPKVYTLYWNYTDFNITAEIRVKTLGWVSFGISNNGKLSDLFVAWITATKSTFIDCHFEGDSIIPE